MFNYEKILTLCTVILLAAAFTGCGKSSEDKSSSTPTNIPTENSDAEKTDEDEKIVVDPFDKVVYGLYWDEYTYDRKYPYDLTIKMDASESPFGSYMSFSYTVEKADLNEIVIKAKANIREIQDFLDKYNYR